MEKVTVSPDFINMKSEKKKERNKLQTEEQD